ncbi:hypothetical protein [Deinococcus hohokamensis]|uniref:Uncharacterized protein n=1 Tax=Deinococcus hohokamensis TaxID=309883 RepID=A0ABV9IDN2_9DEIO
MHTFWWERPFLNIGSLIMVLAGVLLIQPDPGMSQVGRWLFAITYSVVGMSMVLAVIQRKKYLSAAVVALSGGLFLYFWF